MARRWLVLLVFATGCKGKDDPFAADVKLFCEAATKHPDARSLAELAPTFAEDLKTDEFRNIFVVLRGGSIADFEERMRAAMSKAGVTRCPTLDVLMRRP